MSVYAIAIINNHNTPVLIRTKYENSIDLIFKLHSSLDIIEEKQANNNREQFMGVLTQSDSYKIYGLCSVTNTKILMMVNNTTIRDTEARSILKSIYNIYVDVTTNNPFYIHGQPVNSP